MLIKTSIKDLLSGKMSEQDAYEYLLSTSADKYDVSDIKEFIAGVKEFSDDNLSGFSMDGENFIDCCGSGGSGLPHYNTSTTVAFVLAAGGLRVAKFGNRANIGQSGSFDFLDSLEIPIISTASGLHKVMQETNLVFLYARQFYPVLARLAPIRKKIGQNTIINLIGPLLNPFNPAFRIMGVTKSYAQSIIAEYLVSDSNNRNAFVVQSDSGFDELDPASNSSIQAVNESGVKTIRLTADKSLSPPVEALIPEINARYFQTLVSKFDKASPYLQALITLNAGAGFLVSGKVTDLNEGQELAKQLLVSGQVLAKYEQCRKIYAKYS